jgi:hypothetical protein
MWQNPSPFFQKRVCEATIEPDAAKPAGILLDPQQERTSENLLTESTRQETGNPPESQHSINFAL